MFVTNWISTTKIQKISEITNFFRHYFLSRTEVLFTNNFFAPSSVSETKANIKLETMKLGGTFKANVAE